MWISNQYINEIVFNQCNQGMIVFYLFGNSVQETNLQWIIFISLAKYIYNIYIIIIYIYDIIYI